MTRRFMRNNAVVVAVMLLGVASCDQPLSGPAGGAGITVNLVGDAAVLRALDSGIVRLVGPTNRVVRVTPGTTVTISGLSPGTYTVALQGYGTAGMSHFGQATGVAVTAGQNSNASVTFVSFVPVVNPLPTGVTSRTFSVTYASLPNAASYEVEAATNAGFTANRVSVNGTTTTQSLTAPVVGQYFVRVRAVDPFSVPGQWSAVQQIQLVGFLYTIRESDDILQRINPLTNGFTDIGPLGVGYAFGDCAWNPSNSTLYFTEGRSTNSLYRVNVTTGAATLVGAHGIVDMFALAWHPPTATMYGAGGNGNLYRLNLTTGAATVVGATGAGSLNGLAWDAVRSLFVGVNANLGGVTLYTINVTTGAGTVATASAGLDNNGMTYDPVLDRFWVVEYGGTLFQYGPAPAYTRGPALATSLQPHTCIAYVPS
jgi:hypothetical protein